MKRTLVSVSMLACITALAGCGEPAPLSGETASTQPDPATTPPSADSAAAPPMPDTATSADAGATAATSEEKGALGVLNAINEHEIAVGTQAIEKGVSGEIADYARLMIKEHTENRDKTTTFGPDAHDKDAVIQKDKGSAELASLDKLNGDSYSKAYVDAMIKGHTDALTTLDSKLIPKATTQEVKDHLTATREHVANHLERAKSLGKQSP
ncbi:DUF4142 domain-containing protein [Pseudoxanthomonas beigongshangi]